MRKPVSRILVINDEQLVLKEFVKLLNAAAKSLDNPLGITFTGINTAQTSGDTPSALPTSPRALRPATATGNDSQCDGGRR